MISNLVQIFNRLRRGMVAQLQKVNSEAVDTELGLESPIALSIAAEIRLLETLISELAREATPVTANSLEISSIGNLEYYGRLKNIERRQQSRGVYIVKFTATSGGTIERGTLLRAENGVSLSLVNDVSVPAQDSVEGLAITVQAGTENAIPGLKEQAMKATISVGVTGISRDAMITRESVPPRDLEDIETFRRNVENAYKTKSTAGIIEDYRYWAIKIEGIVQVYPYRALSSIEIPQLANFPHVVKSGLGFPVIFIEFQDNQPFEQAYEEYKKEITHNTSLMGGQIILLPCKVLKFDIELHRVRSNENFELEDILSSAREVSRRQFSRIRPRIEGTAETSNDKISASRIQAAIIREIENTGFISKIIIKDENGITVEDYTLKAGEIPVLGNITATED